MSLCFLASAKGVAIASRMCALPTLSETGVHVFGLSIGGGKWSFESGAISDSAFGVLQTPFPVLTLTFQPASGGGETSVPQPREEEGEYRCPLYATRVRGRYDAESGKDHVSRTSNNKRPLRRRCSARRSVYAQPFLNLCGRHSTCHAREAKKSGF